MLLSDILPPHSYTLSVLALFINFVIYSYSEEEYDLETVGSPFHMAPEVLNHKPYNMKVNFVVFSLKKPCHNIAFINNILARRSKSREN